MTGAYAPNLAVSSVLLLYSSTFVSTLSSGMPRLDKIICRIMCDLTHLVYDSVTLIIMSLHIRLDPKGSAVWEKAGCTYSTMMLSAQIDQSCSVHLGTHQGSWRAVTIDCWKVERNRWCNAVLDYTKRVKHNRGLDKYLWQNMPTNTGHSWCLLQQQAE